MIVMAAVTEIMVRVTVAGMTVIVIVLVIVTYVE